MKYKVKPVQTMFVRGYCVMYGPVIVANFGEDRAAAVSKADEMNIKKQQRYDPTKRT